jgi:hypothetical protein
VTSLFRIGGQSIQQADRFLLVLPAQMGVAVGHLGVLVSEQLLNVLNGGPLHDQMRGKGMPEVMKVEILNPCPLHCPGKRPLHFMDRPLSEGEDILRLKLLLLPDGLQRLGHVIVYGDLAGLIGLGLLEVDEAVSDLVPFKGKDLGSAHPRIKPTDHDRLQMGWAFLKKPPDFLLTEKPKALVVLLHRQALPTSKGTPLNHFPLFGLAEEMPETGHFPVHAGLFPDAPILRELLPQMFSVGLQIRISDAGKPCPIAEVFSYVLHRIFLERKVAGLASIVLIVLLDKLLQSGL